MEIEKDTYVDADEATTKALTFDLLAGLHKKMDEVKVCYDKHLGICEKRFKRLEDRKKLNTTLIAVSGFLGGLMAGVLRWAGIFK